MHNFKALVLVGTSVVAAGPLSPSACSAVSTIYVTTAGSPITKTVFPSAAAAIEASSVVPDGSTVYQTVFKTHVLSFIPIEPKPKHETAGPTTTIAGTAKPYSGIGTNGWNGTSTTPAGSAATTPGHSTTPSIGADVKRIEKRKAEEVIVTIDGQAVSWLNNYNGDELSTLAYKPQTTASSSAGTLPIYPWDIGSYPRPVAPITTAPRSTPTTLVTSKTSSTTGGTTTTTASITTAARPDDCESALASFFVTFDDLPHFSVANGSQPPDTPPIFNPYRKLYWADHFGYVPPPSDPYPPATPPQLAVYRASGTASDGSPDAGLEASGEIGAGPRSSDSAYWIDAHSAALGCSDGSSSACLLTIHGYVLNQDAPQVTQIVELPSCPGLRNCSLTYVSFDPKFRNLTGFQLNAAVGNTAVNYYIDDVSLSWSNNSCAAQRERATSE